VNIQITYRIGNKNPILLKPDNMPNTVEDDILLMAEVKKTMDTAAKYGLTVEVMTWALIAVQQHPNLPIIDALEYGLCEWVK
jgi:hypothetical protein